MNNMKLLFEVCEYLYYIIFLWQKKLNGEGWARFSSFYLPGIIISLNLMLLPALLLELYSQLEQELIYVILGIFILYFSIRFELNHDMIMNKFQNETKENIKLWKKKLFYLIAFSIVWLIVIFFIYQILRPDEVQNSYPSEEVLNQLRNIRNLNVE